MNILITGGAGYIGSVVSEHLIIVGHHLFILDDLRDGNKSAVPAKAHFVQSDFGNEKTLFDLFSTKNIEVVIHLAALANVPDSVVNPIEYYENNILDGSDLEAEAEVLLRWTRILAGREGLHFTADRDISYFKDPETIYILEVGNRKGIY